jgi:hypothetical protein
MTNPNPKHENTEPMTKDDSMNPAVASALKEATKNPTVAAVLLIVGAWLSYIGLVGPNATEKALLEERWKNTVHMELRDIKTSLESMRQERADQWTRRDMENYIYEARAKTGIEFPVPQK